MSLEQLVAGLEYLEAQIEIQQKILALLPVFSVEWDFEHSVLECWLIERLSIKS